MSKVSTSHTYVMTGNQAFGAKTAKATLGDLESMLPASPSSTEFV